MYSTVLNPRARFTAVSFSLLTLQSRCFVARNTNSSRSQKHLARRCQRRARRDLRASYHIFHRVRSNLPKRGGQIPTTSASRSLAVKTRILRKSPAFRRIVCRESLIQFSRSRLSSFQRYRFIRRILSFFLPL